MEKQKYTRQQLEKMKREIMKEHHSVIDINLDKMSAEWCVYCVWDWSLAMHKIMKMWIDRMSITEWLSEKCVKDGRHKEFNY